MSIENGNVADQADKFAFGFTGDFLRDFFFSFLEFAEFYLDEFMVV